ncbi:uncharacterized protein MONBRDRAFT_34287 [Monosiga brevicollis MX1]|uniref:Elongation of fatty acids protein n=1 Tax=Monosiga brevicollis TaxID=81824 RepID=A9VAQ9_MONBE|nr:uncharacterized protein MONBRDRAFT_34287 [Monosiga brevicollis MX1]EDQ85417.1 predicted protein [Monosiga brevicollis MX1]|eukprot:XP_001749828.1 hypothetical protein [Monosiga brevicollis MX1]
MESQADPRVQDWFLMSSPVPTMALTVLYLAFVFIGRIVMKNRKPFELRGPILVYNAVLVALNAWICFELVDSFIKENMSFKCNGVNTDPNNKNSKRIAVAIWWYYFSKCIEFLDTVFFVLRKKDEQISFLHLFHHSTMFNLWWMGVRWVPGGTSTISAAINSGVHIIMYTYYALAAIPAMRPHLWWKRYLTQVQLTQFFVIFGSTSMALVETRAGRCNFYEWMGWANLLYMILMISLFSLFYTKAYSKGKGKGAKAGRDDKAASSSSAAAATATSTAVKSDARRRIKAST